MSHRRLLSFALVLLIGALPIALSQLKAEPESSSLLDSGPTGLLIFYRVPAASRAAFRRIMRTTGVVQLHRLQNRSIFATSNLYFSRYADSDAWDMVLFLTFHSYADVSRWNLVETESPGGLPSSALALTSAISTYPVDVVESRSSDTRSEGDQHVILIVPYQVVIPIPDYERYAAGYVQPQLDGWMQQGILSRYQLTVGRGAAGRPYSAVLMLEYKNNESFGRRDRVLSDTRQRLMSNPVWKAFADTKQAIRTEKPAIIADELR